jgi:hypothetical protein
MEKPMYDKPMDTSDMRCYPFPNCPEYRQCGHAGNERAVVAMNCMPYRAEGVPCGWFVQRVEVEA